MWNRDAFCRTGDSRFCGILIVIALASWLVGCDGRRDASGVSNPDRLHITGTIPAAGEAFRGHLTVVFDQPLAQPAGSDTVTTVGQVFDPILPGRVRFGENYLILEDSHSFLPVPVFETHLTSVVRGRADRTLAPEDARIVLTTETFKPKRLWVIDESTTGTVLCLNWPVAVEPEALRSFLTVTDAAGQPVAYELSRGTAPELVRVAVAPGTAMPVTMEIAAGVPEAGGRFRMREAAELVSPVRDPLRIRCPGWLRADGNSQTARLLFTDRVSLKSLQEHLSVEDISTTTTRLLEYWLSETSTVTPPYEIHVRFKAPNPQNVKVRLKIDEGLVGEDLNPLPGRWSRELAIRTQLRIDGHDWDRWGEDPGLLLSFNYPLELEAVLAALKVDPPLDELAVVQERGKRFRIRGSWRLDRRYRITLEPGIHFADWAILKKPLTQLVTTPNSPGQYLAFPETERYYFPRRYGNVAPVRSRGFERLTVRLHRVFANNLSRAVISGHQVSSATIALLSEPVGERRIEVKNDPWNTTVTPIELDRLTSETLRGIYYVEAIGNHSHSARRLVLMTEIGLLAHWQNDQLVVFAHDLFTLEPLAGARVTVYSSKNQRLGETRTDVEGLARLVGFQEALGEPNVLVVEKGEDFTYLSLDSPWPGRAPRDLLAAPPYDREAYDAYFYADRELYRPGDTVHLRWIVRQDYGDALADAPMALTILKPNGKSLLNRTVELSEWGTASLDVETRKDNPTGTYQVRLSIPGSKQVIGEYAFKVEEFVPKRMKAELSVANRWIAGEGPFEVKLTARHLFGTAAVDRMAAASLAKSNRYRIAQWPDFEFGNDSSLPSKHIGLGVAKTDAAGEAIFTCDPDRLSNVLQPVRLRIQGYVSELGGRQVSATGAETVWFPARVLLGLDLEPSTRTQDLTARVVAVRPDGTPTETTTATLTLEQLQWDYNVRGYRTHHEATFSDRYEQVEARTVRLSAGQGQTDFDVPAFGHYRITARTEGSAHYSQAYFTSYGGRPRVVSATEPELLRIALEKSTYAPGETARIYLESPFDGQGLVVVQGEGIYLAKPVEIRDQRASLDIPVSADWYPNVWIKASVVHAIDENQQQVYPISSIAMTELRVLEPKRKIVVDLPDLPEETRPGPGLTIQVRTQTPDGRPTAAEVTLAAVDEGIHSITGYRNPDPLDWFGRTRRPALGYAQYYDRIARRWEEPEPGGDGSVGGIGGERLGRLGMNWIKSVALWSGVVRTGEDGVTTVTLDIPEFSGQLRVVAVAVNRNATGMTAKRLFVRRPWMLRTSMPRFMLPGDAAQCLATVYNNSPATCTARLNVATSGTLAIDRRTTQTEARIVPPHREATWRVGIKALSKPGQGALDWRAEILDPAGRILETLIEHAPLPVGEPSAYERRHTFAVVMPGEQREFSAEDFIQDDWTKLEVTVGANPLLRLHKTLSDVVGYPYGCVEQTTSRLMSLYLLRRNAALLAEATGEIGDLNHYLQTGMDRLFSMQTASGGLAFWPGSNHPYPYGSIYALHFLTLVRNDRELALDANDFALLQRYVRKLSQDPANMSASGLYQRAYAVYVLALAGDREAIDTIHWFDNVPMPRSARYLLAAALAMNTRDSDRVRLYLDTAPSFTYDLRLSAGTLNSPMRNAAVKLLALLEMGGREEEAARMADELSRHLETDRYGSTQERAFIIVALGRYLENLGENVQQASATLSWPDSQRMLSGGEIVRERRTGPGAGFRLSNTGKMPIYVNATASGIPKEPIATAVSQGVTLKRRLLDRSGLAVRDGRLRQGESYLVEWSIENARQLEHFVVADLLPAGLEVENPRLNANSRIGIQLPHAPSQPSHMEVRDDRMVVVFEQLGRKFKAPHYYYYVVNAVTPGTFQQPGVVGECMYDPATRGASVAGQVVVTTE